MSLETCINGSHGAFCLARFGLLPSKLAEDTSDTLTHHGFGALDCQSQTMPTAAKPNEKISWQNATSSEQYRKKRTAGVEFRGCITLGLLIQVVFLQPAAATNATGNLLQGLSKRCLSCFRWFPIQLLWQNTLWITGFCRPGPTRQPWHLLGTIAMIARESVSSKQRLPVSSQIW